jgi:hypothetical protein
MWITAAPRTGVHLNRFDGFRGSQFFTGGPDHAIFLI